MKNILFLVVLFTFNLNAKNIESINEPIAIMEKFTEEFKRVNSSELTPRVIEEILKQYPTSKLAAVYKNSKNEFKLIMVLQSGTRRTVYIDSYGRWFKLN